MANEPQPQRGQRTPSAPRWLAEDAQAIWRGYAKELWALGLLTAVDQDALAVLCETTALYRTAVEMMAKPGGKVQTTESGYLQVTPWVSIRNQTQAQLGRLWAEFGMTPSSRSGVTVAQDADEPTLAEMLFGVEVG